MSINRDDQRWASALARAEQQSAADREELNRRIHDSVRRYLSDPLLHYRVDMVMNALGKDRYDEQALRSVLEVLVTVEFTDEIMERANV
jgi:hypothetical protein